MRSRMLTGQSVLTGAHLFKPAGLKSAIQLTKSVKPNPILYI